MDSKLDDPEKGRELYLDEVFRDAVTHPPPNVKIKYPAWCRDLNDLHYYMFPQLSLMYEQCRKSDRHHVIDLGSSFTFVSSAAIRVEHHPHPRSGSRIPSSPVCYSYAVQPCEHSAGSPHNRRNDERVKYHNPNGTPGTSFINSSRASPSPRVKFESNTVGQSAPNARESAFGCMGTDVRSSTHGRENADGGLHDVQYHRDPFTTVPMMMMSMSCNSASWMCSDSQAQTSSLRQSFFGSRRPLTGPSGTKAFMAAEAGKVSYNDNVGFFSHIKAALCRLIPEAFSTATSTSKLPNAFSTLVKVKDGDAGSLDSMNVMNTSLLSTKSQNSFFSSAPSAYQVQQQQQSLCNMIPLVGTTGMSLLEWLQNGEDGNEEEKQDEGGGKSSSSCPTASPFFSRMALPLEQLSSPLPMIEVSPLFDDSVLSILRDHFLLFVYDHLLLAAQLLLGEHHKDFEREIYKVYQPVLKISLEEHVSSLENLVKPFAEGQCLANSASKGNINDPLHVRNSVRNGVKFKSINRRILEKIVSSAPLSSDLSERFQLLLLLIDDQVDLDERGDQSRKAYMSDAQPRKENDCHAVVPTYPLCVRAALFSGCLLPLYHLFPNETTSRFTSADIQFCLKGMMGLLDIPNDIIPFCHLHAQLISTSIAETREHQCVHLRMMAKSVNHLGKMPVPGGMKCSSTPENLFSRSCTRKGNENEKTISVKCKYCYYVLHESFAIAMTAMPWLDTLLETKEAAISIMALFMEACAAVPSPLLSASTRILGRRIYPMYYERSDFLVSFLAVFLNTGTMRQFQTLISRFPPPETPGAVEEQLNQALLLLQREDGMRYCSTVLSRTILHSKSLLLPCMMQMGVSILLLNWGVLAPVSHSQLAEGVSLPTGSAARVLVPESELLRSISLPSSFVSNVNTLMRFLCRVSCREEDKSKSSALRNGRKSENVPRKNSLTPSPEHNITMSHMLRTFSTSFLSLMSHMIAQWDRQQLAALMDGTRSTVSVWDRTDWIAETSVPAINALMLSWLPPISAIPAPLGNIAVEQHFRRIDAVVELFMRVLERTHVPSSAPILSDPDFLASFNGPSKLESCNLTTVGCAPPGYIHSEWSMRYLERFQAVSRKERKKSHKQSKSSTRQHKNGSIPCNLASHTSSAQLREEKENTEHLRSLVDRLRLLLKISTEVRRFSRQSTEVLQNVERVIGTTNVVENASRRWAPLLQRLELTIARMFHHLAAHALCLDHGCSPHGISRSSVSTSSETMYSPAADRMPTAQSGSSASTIYEMPCGSVFYLLQHYMEAECRVASVQRRWYNPSSSLIEIKSVRSCPRTYPYLTLKDIAVFTEKTLADHFKFLFLSPNDSGMTSEEKESRQRTWDVFQLLVGSYLLTGLYYQTISAEKVHYTRMDAEGISSDLRFLTSWLREITCSVSSTFSLETVRLEDQATVATRRLVLQDIRVMLEELQDTVHHVIIHPSTRLVRGGDGIPPLERLPDSASHTPWNKYILRRILDRRPDDVARTALDHLHRSPAFFSKVTSFFGGKKSRIN